jgi:hypothetical protein
MYKTMSVGDLIAELRKYPKDRPVYCINNFGGGPLLPPTTERADYAPRGSVILKYLWLAPDEYADTVYIDHKGRRKVIKAYDSDD